jgi:hypothetical protein
MANPIIQNDKPMTAGEWLILEPLDQESKIYMRMGMMIMDSKVMMPPRLPSK